MENPACDASAALFDKAIIHLDHHEFNDALVILDVLARQHSNIAEIYRERAKALLCLGQSEAALRNIDQAIVLKPFEAASFDLKGMVLIALSQAEQALRYHTIAAELDQNSAESQCNRAAALKFLGRLEEAVYANNRAIEIEPDLAKAYNNKGLV